MSDFDTVLERLLSDAPFAAALAADPSAALAGYRLDADEAALLRSQVTGDAGGNSAVEERTSKSSTFGLLSPIMALGGIVDSLADTVRAVPATQGFAPVQGLGAGPLADTPPGAVSGFGAAPGLYRSGAYTSGLGAGGVLPESVVPVARTGLGGPVSTSGLGDAPRSGFGSHPVAAQPEEIAPPKGYHNRVDADGDGTWDRSTLRGRADGGVDILVDLDGDGKTDFIGHDVDADRTVDSADYDKNHDGFFEKRMYDDDGDGWLDRSVRRTPPRG
jgi:hypothetical protein